MPGNIRELQNVIERSVIVCDTEEFSVDESWLAWETSSIPSPRPPRADKLAAQATEKAAIEAALAETRGASLANEARQPSSHTGIHAGDEDPLPEHHKHRFKVV